MPTERKPLISAVSFNRKMLRAKLLHQLKIANMDDKHVDHRAKLAIARAKDQRKSVTRNTFNRLEYYRLIARITMAFLLVSEEGLRWLRQECLRGEEKVRDGDDVLRWALKTFGPYDFGEPRTAALSEKRLSRDYQVITYLLSKGITPYSFPAYLGKRGQGLDETYRSSRDELRLRQQPRTMVQVNVEMTALNLARLRSIAKGEVIARLQVGANKFAIRGMHIDPTEVKEFFDLSSRLIQRRKSPAPKIGPKHVKDRE